MKEKLRNFMAGRYGVDQLGRFLLVISLIIMILNTFIRIDIIFIINLLLLVYVNFRTFSRNYQKRYRENNFYLRNRSSFLNIFRKGKNTVNQRKVYHIYQCPKCRQKIRIPKGKGRISITCPKCHTEFIKNS